MSVVAPGLELPELRVVALEQLVLHEDADERRVTALSQRLQAEGVVRNPPVVATLDDDRFVVLDGANRTTALRRLGVPDVVIQVASYDEVRLTTWCHLVTGVRTDTLLAAVGAVDGLQLQPTGLDEARPALAAGRAAAILVLPGGSTWEIQAPGDLAEQVGLLRRTVATYRGRATIQRVQTDDLAAMEALFDDIAALVVFPSYRPADILALARLAAKLPTGITRHVIPRRALRVNTELSFLWEEVPRAEKQRRLMEWARHKVQAREVRFYEESTVLYDE